MNTRTNTARFEVVEAAEVAEAVEHERNLSAPKFKERSTRVRPASRYPVEVHIMGDKFLDIFRARDISVTGIGIYVPYRFHGCNILEEMDLCISLPHERPFMAKGNVVHRTGDDRPFFGIVFTSISEKNRLRVQNYIGTRLAQLPETLRNRNAESTHATSILS